jgi:hypothetical protein
MDNSEINSRNGEKGEERKKERAEIDWIIRDGEREGRRVVG